MKNDYIDCIIVAAGSGKRLGAKTPKAFVKLGDRPLFVHSLLTFCRHGSMNRIILVVPSDMISRARRIIKKCPVKKEIEIIPGGEHRWQSVKNGVDASRAEWVMIHDSARPFVSPEIIDSVIAGSQKYDAVIAATPEVDTVRKFTADRAGDTLDRNELARVQTPQLFRRAKLIEALGHAAFFPLPPTDEAMLMEASGIPVGIAPGDPLNFKITAKQDLTLAQALWEKINRLRRRS
ncbi:MAG TPA: 2-C-methyl-D-erythritol 4-phosphate cytidylyltransferase [Chitinivibrionales bacterium]|nr:2-C-methyl-D-erythritol 4-phosphate cytidylyltransferase [Chitinivibrionales bacterium]